MRLPTRLFQSSSVGGGDAVGATTQTTQERAPVWGLVLAFAALYIIWGSTYLAIRFAVETMPPFLMAGVRFLLAGALLFGWTQLRGGARPTRANWVAAGIVGVLLLAGGNGMVVFAEQFIPSGLAALLISTTPIWMALLDWLRPGGKRPTMPVFLGLGLGFIGVALLIGPNALAPGHGGLHISNPIGLFIVPLAAFSWALGSIYSRGAKMPASPLVGTGLEMLAGGAVLLLAGVAVGEPAHVHVQAITLRSALAFVYLVIFGSLVAFTAFVWLLRVAPLSRVSTYAYVNPVVAVFLGWAFDNDKLTALTVIAAGVIVGAVVVITTFRAPATAQAQGTAAEKSV